MGVHDEGVVTEEPQAVRGSAAPTTAAPPPTVKVCSTGVSAPGGESCAQQPQVRVLTLNHKDHLDSTLFRLQKGWVVQLRPGPTLLGRRVSVFTNQPQTPEDGFTRNKYRHLQWRSDSHNKGDDTALEDKDKAQGSGFYLVDPTLTVGTNDEVLSQDCVQCQTVLSKCLGPLPDWEQRLQVAHESGYNMIHFTPIQELGDSNSNYSLKDQHNLNIEFQIPDHKFTFDDVDTLVRKMKQEWKVLSLTDIVLNHTANETPWLQEHPESTYNCNNCTYLRPAYLLDRALYHMTLEVMDGKWTDRGIPVEITEEKHIEAIKNALHNYFLPQVKLHDFYIVDLDKIVEEFRGRISSTVPCPLASTEEVSKNSLVILQDPQYGRKTCTVDMNIAVRLYNLPKPEAGDEAERVARCGSALRRHLEHLNEQRASEIQAHLIKAVDCCLGTIRYFTHYGKDTTLEDEEALMFGRQASFLMAHNGWVMGDDPLKNFARKESYVYLRRELVAWGDSVKLRYGDEPQDSPFLWDLMRRYCEYTARIFHGIRLDNCHSTPIHVAEYMLDAARKVRPDLYVIAELFTNSDLTDNIFINRLGINSLVREAMSAPDSHEEGRLVYLYGGEPVGAFLLPPVRPLVPSVAHAIFLDLTHDNRSPAEVRTAWDMLPSAALVSMACCASGSNRGYDELVPHHIHVVDETRLYSAWSESGGAQRGEVNNKSGIIECKNLLNKLHFELGANGFNQVFVDQVTEHVVTVTRHNPVTHQSVVLVAYTAFRPPAQIQAGSIRPLKVQGRLEEIIFEMQVKGKKPGEEDKKIPGVFVPDLEFINGLDGFSVEAREHLTPAQSSFVQVTSGDDADMTVCEYTSSFTPGSVIAFRLSLLPRAQSAVNKIRGTLSEFGYKSRISEVTTHNPELTEIMNDLSLGDLNRVLYRCDDEEKDEGRGWGAYAIPGHGPLLYCGLQGVVSVLSEIRVINDLGHPLCGNLRDGDWLAEYIVGRLKFEPSTQRLAAWLEEVFGSLSEVPRYLIPAYFDSIITSLYLTLINRAWALMGEFISGGSNFVKALGLCSVQFCGTVKSALLPALSPHLRDPKPPTVSDGSGGHIQLSATIAAGLPHFSVGYMRNWGRDTFIALPGNLLIPSRHDEARWILLAFAGTLRHGLIPNLLDGGKKARFNCRDSFWFWLQAIQRYVTVVPDGHLILKDKVSRLYPTDDSPPQEPGKHDQPLEEVIQEGLQHHFQGIKFRERNAGFQIDRQMNDDGFNNNVGVDLETGFVYGGSVHNCGTWMDKMGSSEQAGTKGKPATPRDGSAVEIVGLCKAALAFLGRMHTEGKYTFNSVERCDETGKVTKWSYEFWENKIVENFEKHFWVSETPEPEREPKPELIHRRGIYKDSHNASQFWADFQLRCNFPIALAVAPELTTPQNAWAALKTAEEVLLGPLGIKTLDPKDWGYNGNYDNANNTADSKLAHGFNYHQGPEWLWPVGWLLRAQLAVAPRVGGAEQLVRTIGHVKSLMANHLTHLLTSPWRSLPELTNAEGAFCRDSNPAQSWSTGCLLECQHDFPLHDNTQHYKSINSQESSFNLAYPALPRASPTSRIVITTKNFDPSFSYVKEVDVGNTVISYVPRNVVFSEDPDFFDTVHDVVHVKCFQSDIDFSIALLCKPQDVSENCLVVWAVDEKVRQNAMWSSPEYVKIRDVKSPISGQESWLRGTGGESRDQQPSPSSRGPVMVEPLYQTVMSGQKKYQGRVPSIVALLTHHANAKTHQSHQKSALQSDMSLPKVFPDSLLEKDHEIWQQNRFAPVSREIHKTLAAEEETHYEACVKQKVDAFNKGGGYGFSYHLSPSSVPSSPSRPSVLNLPPPPQMPLPPVPECHDEPDPGTGLTPAKPSVSWKEFQSSAAKCQPMAQRLSESVSFLNPYTRKAEYEAAVDAKSGSQIVVTPHAEKLRRESTSLFLAEEDLVKPRDIDPQKLSTVLVLSLFVVALLIFYLVYFL
ncbi:Glycogen debranching enzyme [Chionoecetes opilio]|uniref:Glycogen debranching enzyme n=1 Tax=Chionoecetes opilio TaxID=41210 RepID=A0A8J5C0S3_CHIOP|nr:Glycogen debranching enzyme [Chionoecetes opilio]